MKKLGREGFIERAKAAHGDRYDYSKVEYKDNKTKICIICPEHGEFWQIPSNHLKGVGCPKCANRNHAEARTMDLDTPNMHINDMEGCPNCSSNTSKGETELYDYFVSLGINVIRKDKTLLDGMEIDLLFPDYDLGVEYNGLR